MYLQKSVFVLFEAMSTRNVAKKLVQKGAFKRFVRSVLRVHQSKVIPNNLNVQSTLHCSIAFTI